MDLSKLIRLAGTILCATAVLTAFAFPAAAEGLFNSDFEQDADIDNFPDGWTQVYGPGMQHYACFELTDKKPFSGKRSLVFQLVGSSARLLSTPFRISPKFSFRISIYVKAVDVDAEGLRKTHARLGVEFLDESGRVIGRMETEPVTGTTDWRRLELKVAQPPEKGTSARLTITVEGRDISGALYFDKAGCVKLPRVQLTTAQPGNIFARDEEKIIHLFVGGLKDREYTGSARLVDEFAQTVYSASDRFKPGPDGVHRKAFRLNISRPGVYKFAYTMDVGGLKTSAEAHLGIIQAESSSLLRPDFGIVVSGPAGSPAALAEVAHKLGVGWVKIPVLQGAGEENEKYRKVIDELIRHFSVRGLHVVGVLGPAREPEQMQTGAKSEAPYAAVYDAFAPKDRGKWQSIVENAVGRYADRLEVWQLGLDADSSCRDRSSLEAARAVGAVIRPLTGGPSVGIPIRYLYSPRNFSTVKPTYVNLYLDGGEDPAEIPAMVRSLGSPSPKWITVALTSKRTYHRVALIAALTERLIHAKRSGADVIFFDPFQGSDRGLVDSRNAPTFFYFIVNTLIKHLSGRRWRETTKLPNGSVLHVFEDDKSVVIIGWNDRGDTEERVYLGSGLTRVELTGTQKPVAAKGFDQFVRFGREPIILTGVDTGLFRTMRSIKLDRGQLASTLEQQRLSISIDNHLATPVRGAIELSFPRGWVTSKRIFRFNLGLGASWAGKFSVRLPSRERTGVHRIRARVILVGEKKHLLRIERPIEIVLLGVSTQIDVQRMKGDLGLVTFKITNTRENPVSFTAFLEAFRQERTEHQFQALPPGKSRERVFTVRDISKLQGTPVWVGLREIGGKRFFNRFIRFESRKGDYYEILP